MLAPVRFTACVILSAFSSSRRAPSNTLSCSSMEQTRMTCLAPSAFRTESRSSSSSSLLLLALAALASASRAASLHRYSSSSRGGQSARTCRTQLEARNSTIGPVGSQCTRMLKEKRPPGGSRLANSSRFSRMAPAQRTNFWLPISLRVSGQMLSTCSSSTSGGVRLCTLCSQKRDRRVSTWARCRSNERKEARIVARSATRCSTPSSPTWLRIVSVRDATAPVSSVNR
mmetsp:Transcript_29179/g.82290  ORF Transcript_29179/g.82290 Transcript_29179/m.82290 type:complete len:229 (-) Transcript_29179:807-1493(-)